MPLQNNTLIIIPKYILETHILKLEYFKGRVMDWIAILFADRIIYPLNFTKRHLVCPWYSIKIFLLANHELFVYIPHKFALKFTKSCLRLLFEMIVSLFYSSSWIIEFPYLWALVYNTIFVVDNSTERTYPYTC